MKIMFLIGDLRKGGAERVITNLSNYLCVDNKITILMTSIKRIEYTINSKVKIAGLEEEKHENRIIKNIKILYRMKKIILKERPDVIVSFLKEPTNRILLLKGFNRKIKKIPLIVSIRNDPKIVFKSMLDKIFLKTLYNLPEGYVFQTDEAKAYFNEKIQLRSEIIPNPIDLTFIDQEYPKTRKSVIVSVGKLMPQKNHHLLIEAFKEISEEYKEFKLYIYGEGEMREELENLINSYHLTDRIFLKGNVDNIKEQIIDAKIFIMTSNYEGMPNALMEAMALGLPCISTDCPCGGPKFLIKNEYNGLLFKVGDKEELVRNIKKLIDDENLANTIGKNAKKISIDLHPDKISEKWKKNIYNFKNIT